MNRTKVTAALLSISAITHLSVSEGVKPGHIPNGLPPLSQQDSTHERNVIRKSIDEGNDFVDAPLKPDAPKAWYPKWLTGQDALQCKEHDRGCKKK